MASRHVLGPSLKRSRRSSKSKSTSALQTWALGDMDAAVALVVGGTYSVREAAHRHGVPKSTLSDYVHDARGPRLPSKKKLGRSTILSPAMEQRLSEYLQDRAELHVPMTLEQFADKVAEFGRAHGVAWLTPGSKPSRKWLRGFRERHAEISLRVAQRFPLHRVLRSATLIDWLTMYKRWADDTPGLSSEYIYNMDEIIFSGDGRVVRVLARTGMSSLQMLDPDRPTHITVIVCGNARGDFLPPLFVLKGGMSEIARELAAEEEVDSFNGLIVSTPSGWVDGQCYTSWVTDVFIPYARPSGGYPVTLILDNLAVHHNEDAQIRLAEAGVTVITLPPRTTHKLQPLDVAVFAQLKSKYGKWRQVSATERQEIRPTSLLERIKAISLIVQDAQLRTSMRRGFRKTGLWPPDPTKLVPSAATKRALARAHAAKASDVLGIPKLKQRPARNTRLPKLEHVIETPGQVKQRYRDHKLAQIARRCWGPLVRKLRRHSKKLGSKRGVTAGPAAAAAAESETGTQVHCMRALLRYPDNPRMMSQPPWLLVQGPARSTRKRRLADISGTCSGDATQARSAPAQCHTGTKIRESWAQAVRLVHTVSELIVLTASSRPTPRSSSTQIATHLQSVGVSALQRNR